MKRMWRIALGLLVLAAVVAAWLWWQRPRRVEMARYVPADTLIYLETNSLPALAEALTQTEAWRVAAQPAGLDANAGNIGWWGRLAAWTGFGPADKVALARAQVAVAVLGANLGAGSDALKLKPQYAVVVETHTNAARLRAVVEEKIGAFATRAYGSPRVERREENGAGFTFWHAPESGKGIVAVFSGSVIILGPGEAAARACLDAKNGARPSLEGNAGLTALRSRVDARNSLAFGYVAPEGLSEILKLAATAYAAPLVLSDPRIGIAVNSFLPALPPKITNGLGWSARVNQGNMEDRYFLTLKNGLADNLREPLAAENNGAQNLAQFAPARAYSLSQYNFRQPGAAWAGLNRSLAAQLDIVGAVLVTRLLAAAFQPYGIEEPGAFLKALGPEAATLRINEADGGPVTIVKVNDETALRAFAGKHLGADARRETVEDTEMLTAADEERGACAFAGGYFLLGPAATVRECLVTRAENPAFRAAFPPVTGAQVVTYTKDQKAARAFLAVVATNNTHPAALTNALNQLPYAVSETRLLGDGIEKRGRSSFGLIGAVAAQFAP